MCSGSLLKFEELAEKRSNLTSEDHDIFDGICLQYWKLINCNDKVFDVRAHA